MGVATSSGRGPRYLARRLGLLLGSGLLLATTGVVVEAQAAGATPTGVTYYVNSATDDSPSYATDCTTPTNTDCGIDDAINAFDNDSTADDADTIVFNSSISTFDVTNPTPILNTTSGITLAIDGNGQSATAVSGENANPVFDIPGGTVTISGLTIEDGSGYDGGGVVNEGTATLADDTLSGNSATVGGGVFNAGTATLTDDTLSDDSAYSGGGVYNDATATLTDDTLSGNPASYEGGGVWNSGTATLSDDTFSQNSAPSGGGFYNYNGTATLANNILDDGVGECDNAGTINDGGYNVEADDSCGLSSSSVVNSSTINLATSLAPNGSNGPETLAIGTDSSAYDEVPTSPTDDCTITTDERGAPRPGIQGESCDAGAYELQGGATATLYVNGTTGNDSNWCDTSSAPCLTIQQAINIAQSFDPTAVTIDVAAGTYDELDTISASGLASLSIDGSGQSATFVSGQNGLGPDGYGSVFTVNSGTVTISGITIEDGSASNGGGVYNLGTATLTDDTLSGNSAEYGGGFDNVHTVTLTDDTLSNNSAPSGGGVFNAAFATATLTDDTLSGNSAFDGGGVDNGGGFATLTNDTLSGNSAESGSGVLNAANTVTLANSILDDPGECYSESGAIIDGGYNVEADDSCGLTTRSIQGSSTINLATSLAPNGSNGPETLAIGTNSSAYDEVPTSPTNYCTITTDERSASRPGVPGENCDAGAYEWQQPTLGTTPSTTSATFGTATVLRDTAALSGGFDPTGSLTFTLYDPTGAKVDSETVSPLSGDGSYSTPIGYALPITNATTVAGTYQWDASYSGDGNNGSVADNNAADEQVTVSPASTSLTYTGPSQVAVNSTLSATATLSSAAAACENTQPVSFTVAPDPLNNSVSSLSFGPTNSSATGAVSLSVSTKSWINGIYLISATDSPITANCSGVTSASVPLAVTVPGQFAFGYGAYAPSLGLTNFGFVVTQVHAKTVTYQGQLGLVTPGKWLFEANVTSFKVSTSTQGLFAGTGTLYYWISTLNKGHGGWQLAKSNVSYSATANASTKTTPASFGITISYTPVAGQPTTLPNSSPLTLTKGGIFIT